MANSPKFYLHFSTLITQARLKKGYATLKELFREQKPPLDYQTWLSAESGRRVPTSKAVILIGDILDIDREPLVIAYCKDKFCDEKSQSMLASLQHNNFISMDTLIDAKNHDRCKDYIFSTKQLTAMKKDPRLRLYLTFTYDKNLKTTINRLENFFNVAKNEVLEMIASLQELGLVEVIGEEIKKIHVHSSIPDAPDLFDLRREILLRSLDFTVKPDSYISNHFVDITEKSYKKVLAFFDFIGANLIKMNKEDEEKMNTFRVQIALTGNKLSDGSNDGGPK